MAYKYQLGEARLAGSLIQEGTIKASGDIMPLNADGASLGGAANEWSDLYLADDAKIYFGADQDIILDHRPDAGLRIQQNPETSGEPILSLKTTGDFASGPGIHFAHDNALGEADGDILGFMNFLGNDSTDTITQFARIEAQSADVTNGSEDGSVKIHTILGGVITNVLDINAGSSANGIFKMHGEGVMIANRGLVAAGAVIDASSGGSMPDSFSCSFVDWNGTGGRYVSRGSNDSTHGSYTLRLETKNASSPRDAIIIDTSGNYTFHDGAYNFDIASHDGSNGLKLGGALVTSAASELNLLDGGTSVGGSITLLDTDGVLVNDGGVSKLIPAANFRSYVSDAPVDVVLKANGGTLAVGVNYFNDMGSDGEDVVTLPAGPVVGQSVRVKASSDCSGTRYITINKAGSQTIDGQTSIRLESPFAAVQLFYVANNVWRVF